MPRHRRSGRSLGNNHGGSVTNRPVHRSEVELGKPLPGDVFDVRGNLLLRAGHVIASQWQLEMLLDKAALADDDAASSESPAAAAARADNPALAQVMSVRRMLHALLTNPPETGFPEEIMEMVGMLAQACQKDTDQVLATILMCREGSYSVRHAVNVAVACQVVGTSLKLAPEEVMLTVAAALTMNIAMVELQDRLHEQAGPLSEDQRAQIRSHCERGVAILCAHGVADALWLDTVRDHHEHADGSGYPAGKVGEAISLPAKLLALADVYCARVSSRDSRPAMSPNLALRWLFLGEGTSTDEHLAAPFIKALGIYPPGTGVRLRNGSVAVVVRRGPAGHQPHLALLATSDGLRLERPIRTGGRGEAFTIVEVVNLAAMRLEPPMALLWGPEGVA